MTEEHKYEFKKIKAKEINVNRLYQRPEKTPLIRKIITEFDYHLVNPVKVVCRDGEYYAWDGQQTSVALRTKFGDNYLVPCMIYYDVPSWVDEAILFENANRKGFRKAVSDAERWTSRINRGEEAATNIQHIVERNGFRIASDGRSGGNKIICAISALDDVYAKYGELVFAEAISNLAMAWDGDAVSVQAPMLRGMAMFVNKYKGEYDRKKLIARLRKYPAAVVMASAKTRIDAKTAKYAEEILAVYNKNAHEKLQNKL